MKPRDAFKDAASRYAAWRREAFPVPKQVAEAGIKTRDSIAWEAQRHPTKPKLTFEHGNAFVRAAAGEAERAEMCARINKMREEFRAKPAKARGDFRLARDYRGVDRER